MNNPVIRGATLDSRKVTPGDVFFAMKGETSDGRQYIQSAIEKGAVAVITEKLIVEKEKYQTSSKVPIIEYDDLKNTLGFIASRFYGEPSSKMKVIGITGTNGKTSCSHFIAQLSNLFNQPSGVIGTLGAGLLHHIKDFGLTSPDAVTLQALLSELYAVGAKNVALEVSSHALMQGRVAGVTFQTAIFTNLTRDHLDYHENFEAYFNAKQKLFTECKPEKAILNVEDPSGQRLAEMGLPVDQIIGITTQDKAPISLDTRHLQGMITTHALKMDDTGCRAEIHSPWGIGKIYCPLLGRFNLSNALAAVAALCLQEYPFKEVLERVSELKPVAGRMNRLGGGPNEPSIVIDYAHTPDALAQVLSALRTHCRGKLWCVFGCGGDRDPGKRALMAIVAEQWSDVVIVTQDNPRTENPDKIMEDILKGFSSERTNILIEADRARAIDIAVAQASPSDLIVIAGKGHETFQIIQTEKIPFVDEHCARQALARRSL